jgi:transposase
MPPRNPNAARFVRRKLRSNVLPLRTRRDTLTIMIRELSPQIEQYLASVVAGGLFPSEEAALEAAIAALREKTEPIPFVPDEHMERLDQAIDSANAGRCREMSDADWESLHQLARDNASGNPPSNV